MSSNKRKSSEQPVTSTKKLKTKSAKAAAKHSSSDESDDEKIQEPSYTEIMESLKPENVLSIETIRQKKKAKHQKNIEERQSGGKEKEIQRNSEYLKLWKTNRAEWKFEKLRQISIQNHLFDMPGMDTDLWQIAMEYLSGAKGMARNSIIKKAEGMISTIEAQMDENNKKELIQSINYTRARELMQLLQ